MDILDYIIIDTERASAKFIKAVSFVPDDKLGFAPAKDSMSAREIAAHIMIVNRAYAAYLLNQPRPYQSMAELFQLSNEDGQKYTRTEPLVASLNDSVNTLLKELRSLPSDILDRDIVTVRGSEKAQSLLQRLAPHFYVHAGQIDYLQTIWGDREIHM